MVSTLNTSLRLKRSDTPGSIPTAGQLAGGELAINTVDGIIYYKKSADSIASFYDIDNSLNTFLTLSGGTMTGPILMGDNRIRGLNDPSQLDDAATKNYVDASIENAGLGQFPTGDYGDLQGATTDAFGVTIATSFDLLTTPTGLLDQFDLGTDSSI